MTLPKNGKVNIKTPQNSGGLPKIAANSYSGPSDKSGTAIKGPLKKNPSPGAAPKPSTKGNKISPIIQTGNPASRTKKFGK